MKKILESVPGGRGLKRLVCLDLQRGPSSAGGWGWIDGLETLKELVHSRHDFVKQLMLGRCGRERQTVRQCGCAQFLLRVCPGLSPSLLETSSGTVLLIDDHG